METTDKAEENHNTRDDPVIDVDEADTGNEANVVNETKGAGSKRSFVWKHFEYVKGSTTKVKCNYCPTIMAAASKLNGTSSMQYHLKNVCKASPVYHQKQVMKNQSKLGYKPPVSGETSGSLGAYSFSQENCRKLLARLCIKDNRPFSVADDEGLRDFSMGLNPLFKFPSRWTVARDCLTIYQEEKMKLKRLLQNQTVSLTTDTWTSVQNCNYMCLTAHWVDEKWMLNKRILNFCQIANHKGSTIGRLVYECIKEWGIKRVFTVTVDNAASNDGAIKYLAKMLKGPDAIFDCKYLHLRCCAHIINLVVRDGLDEQVTSISKIRNAVKYLRSSPARYESFKASVDDENISCKKKPCLDVETRWNSTYLMLETAEKYKKAFDRLGNIDFSYRSYFESEVEDDSEINTRKRKKNDRVLGAPTNEDWENARYFMEYLRIFFNVTKKVSGSKYVTSNMFFYELVKMHAAISKMCLSTDEKKKKMALSMKKKYDKYWDNLDNMNFLLHVGLILDPRNKMHYLGYCLDLIYGKKSKKSKEVSDRAENTLVELFNHYKMKMDKVSDKNKTVSSSSTVILNDVEDMEDEDDAYEKYCEEYGDDDDSSELEVYLADGREKRIKGDDKYDVLGWWKLNEVKFPVLSQLAKHVLAMPVSTVASESAFSTGGRVIDPFRSSLTPTTAEALICSQNWLRSTQADLQDMPIHGTLEDMVENLENMEIDAFPVKKQKCNKSFMDEDSDLD